MDENICIDRQTFLPNYLLQEDFPEIEQLLTMHVTETDVTAYYFSL